MPIWSCPKSGGDYPIICYRDPNEGHCVCEDCGHVSKDSAGLGQKDGQWLTFKEKYQRDPGTLDHYFRDPTNKDRGD